MWNIFREILRFYLYLLHKKLGKNIGRFGRIVKEKGMSKDFKMIIQGIGEDFEMIVYEN